MRISGILQDTSSLKRAFNGIVNSLTYLTSPTQNRQIVSSLMKKEVHRNVASVTIDDSSALSKINDKFDVIVTDPPYSIDVPYGELSDFYYVWLKRALSDSDGIKLTPRFYAEAFFKRIGAKSVETKTQWQEFAKREVSEFSARYYRLPNKGKLASDQFRNLLTQSFIAMREKLEDEGVLVTYYAHTSQKRGRIC